MYQKTCKNCGTEFLTLWPTTKYCSWECNIKARHHGTMRANADLYPEFKQEFKEK